MISLYTVLTSLLSVLLLPFLLPLASRKKYRQHIGKRLGWGLAAHMTRSASDVPTIWLHALSVGEVTSALPLVHGLRLKFPKLRIVVSASTRSGNEVAKKLLAPYSDALIAAPLDLGAIVPFFIKTIKPDLFILVETDFWPHWLHCLRRHGIPAVLVNGRVSAQSARRYQRARLFFAPMFRCFSLLAMQTALDADNMLALGIDPLSVQTLGNLKFDTSRIAPAQRRPETLATQKKRYGFDAHTPLWVCGSTHRGEEDPLLQAYLRLREKTPGIQLLLAPRTIERAEEIIDIARSYGLECRRWSTDRHSQGPLLLLDTIGELATCYLMADAVFVGGSLVAQGGHNPIEPAVAGTPVLFGPHMEDFAEIAAELIRLGGARQIASGEELVLLLQQILENPALRQAMADAARACVQAHQGLVSRHLEAIDALLAERLDRQKRTRAV